MSMKTFVLTVSLLTALATSSLAQSVRGNGNEVGYDPDPQVRLQLRRDAQWRTGG